MSAPTLSIGLPVYNGERYLAEALDDLLAQTFTDFELILSDNASTDATAEICRRYADRDDRIRYVRLPRNIGASGNHNAVVAMARGTWFKWASHDDRYAPDLLERCLDALAEHPEAVLAHAWSGFIDEHGAPLPPAAYTLRTDSPDAPTRFRSLLLDTGGNDVYGIARTELFRRISPLGSHHHADRTWVAELALQGAFHQVPEVLYLRRDHPQRAERAGTRRARSANLDPRRGDVWRHPMSRLYAEYVWAYVRAIRHSPLSARDRARCFAHLTGWLVGLFRPGHGDRLLHDPDPAVRSRAERSRRRPAPDIAPDAAPDVASTIASDVVSGGPR